MPSSMKKSIASCCAITVCPDLIVLMIVMSPSNCLGCSLLLNSPLLMVGSGMAHRVWVTGTNLYISPCSAALVWAGIHVPSLSRWRAQHQPGESHPIGSSLQCFSHGYI
ncbi:hypothetical protein GDO81_011682 [Engystomops pustulosus]|uniref:Uncharacterized protein n=1 Tax=Engystomops pustulosus TaxID=76066 RepID=A0AAV7BFZ6_ENGPU|nr:hypothetical protein GDO81_011682 [Engystomops pustulosus]